MSDEGALFKLERLFIDCPICAAEWPLLIQEYPTELIWMSTPVWDALRGDCPRPEEQQLWRRGYDRLCLCGGERGFV